MNNLTISKTLLMSFLWIGLFPLFMTQSLNAQPAGFLDQEYVGNFSQAVGMTFDANGRMYVSEKAGKIWVVENGSRLPNPLLDISDEVGGWRDFGLLGVALDPNFLSNGYIYMLYIVDLHHVLNAGTASYNPNTNQYFDATIGRITRYTAQASTNFTTVDYNSRKVLLGATANDGFPNLHQSHGTGSLVFGTDGTLLASFGDGASYSSVDQGSASETYYQNAISNNIITSAENIGAYRSQLLNNYAGKVLRIDPETGAGIPSNPYYQANNPQSRRSKVWARGLRNPCRFSKRPETGSHDPAAGDPGTFYIGDVGWGSREELNVMNAPAQNFGWPKFEGMTHQPGYNNNTYAPANHTLAKVDWRSGAARAHVNGQTYNIGSAQVPGPNFTGNCSIGGVWYTADDFPSEYKNTYFHADYGGDWIMNFGFDSNDNPTFVKSFKTGANAIVFVATNPIDGALYYIAGAQGNSNGATNAVRKISYVGGSFPPIAVAKADQLYGSSPLTVSFDGSQSFDPDNGPLTYLWDFGDGTTSNSINPIHEFTTASNSPSSFTITLTVTDQENLNSQKALTLSLNNTPPTISSTSIDNINTFTINNSTNLSLSATVSDAEHSNASLSYQWFTELHHNDHFHPEAPDTNPQTSTVISPVGCDGSTYFYRIRLVVTDPGGLSSEFHKDIYPACAGSSQSISFGALADKFVTDGDFNISATASSGLPVVFHIVDGPASVSGNTISLNGNPGLVIIRAIQSGNGSYRPATVVERSFEVKTLNPDCPNTGTISREVWTGLSTSSVTISSIPLNTTPNIEDEISFFETPTNILEGYGTRVRGYICPPVSGNYVFWIASDDNGELWLSTDNNPANKTLIAEVPVWTSSREWNKYPEQQSASINLTAGNRYYVEALMKEGGGGDNLAVGFQLPSGNLQRPIPGLYLIPWDGGLQDQSISFAALADKLTTDADFGISATASSGLPVSFSIVSGPASISGNTISLNGQEGTVVVRASQGGNSSYNPANTVDRSFEVTAPTGGCNNPSNLALNKPSSQSGTQQGGSADRANDGNTNGSFWAGQSVAQTNWQAQPWWEVDLGENATIQDIRIWNRNDVNEGFLTNYYVLVSPIPFASQNLAATLNQAGVSNFERTSVAGRPTTVNVNQNGRYVRIQLQGTAFLSLSEVEVIGCGGGGGLLDQTITFAAIPDKQTNSPNFAVNASASSGLPISYSIVSGPASIAGNTINLSGQSGTVTVRASQNGNGQYNPATAVERSFDVTLANGGGCSSPSNLAVGQPSSQSSTQQSADADRGNDSNTSGLFFQDQSVIQTGWQAQPWWEVDLGQIYTIESIRLWNREDGNEIFLNKYYLLVSDVPFNSSSLSATLGQAGVSDYFQNSQAGRPSTATINRDGRYVRIQLQGSAFLSFAELEVIGCPSNTEPIDQSITFASISDKLTSDSDFDLVASASSNLPVSFQIISGPASINGNTVTLNGAEGTVIVSATQAGNGNYNPAPAVNRSFEVTAPSGPPGIVITSPTDGELIQGGSITVQYQKTGDWLGAGVDHIHLSIDGTQVATDNAATGSYTLNNISAGAHTLTAQLAASNHQPLTNPESMDNVQFTIEALSNQIDLELSITADNSSLPIWQFVNFTIDLVNNGGITANNIIVQVPVPTGFAFADLTAGAGNYTPWTQQWTIPSLAAGASATVELSLFTLQDQQPVDYFVQVLDADEDDADSTPNNNGSTSPAEDDEAVVNLAASNSANIRASDGLWFDAYRNGMTVELHWLSRLEPVVEEFIIEHWTDGADYQPLRSHLPLPNANGKNYYQDKHLQPVAGTNYYRLKQILRDGSMIESPVRKLYFEPNVEDIELFPNPAEDYVELQLRPLTGESVELTIYDHLGRERYKESIDEVAAAPHRIDLSELPEGHYLVWVYTKSRKPVAKQLVIGKR